MAGDDTHELAVRVPTIERPADGVPDIAAQLTSEGHGALVVQSVSDVDAARRALSTDHVECVVCEHDPPAIDGVETLVALREDHPDLPILLATETEHADSALGVAATDVVSVSDGTINPGIVTNRIKSIAAHTRERGKYEQIFEEANDGIVVHESETGDIVEANRRFYRMLGYEPDDEQLRFGDVVAGTEKYTEARARELVRQAADEGGQTVEWLVQTADGNERWVEVSHEPAILGGVERVLAFVRDITDRKESERLLRDRERQLEAVFDHPASFAVVLDGGGRVVRANRPALEHVDASLADIEGLPLWETPWWTGDGRQAERVRNAVESATSGAGASQVVDIETDDGVRTFDLRFEPVSADGDVSRSTRCVVVGYDITERKEREREAREHRETLRRLHEITADPDRTLEEQFQELLQFGADRLGLDVAFLSRIDTATNHFEIVQARGDHPMIRAGNEADLAETYCRRTVATDTESPLAIQTASEELADDSAFRKYGLGCYLGAEIVVDGERYGTLCFADESPRREEFSSDERTLVDLMAQWVRRSLEQRQSQRELGAARDRFERTLERVDDAFFALDDEWHVTYVNEAGADVLRQAMGTDYDTDELLGRHLWDEIPEAVGTTFYDQYREALETQESVSFEEYFDPMDVWFEVRAHPDEEGLSVYFTDVTERKERQRELQRLRELLEQTERIADVGGWEIDVETMTVFWSDHLFDMLGVDGSNEPPLEEALDAYLDADRPVVERAIEAAIETAEPFDVEARYRRSEGDDVRWLRVQGVPVLDDGDVVTIRGAAQEITERKERERTLSDLLDATQAFVRANDRDELADAIIEGADAVFDYDISSVRLHDAEAGTLPVTHVSRTAAEYVSDPPTFDDTAGPVGEAFQSNEPVVVDDLPAAIDHDYGPIRTAMYFPIDDYGVLGIGSEEPDAFNDVDGTLIGLLAVAAANVFDRLEREAETRHLKRIIDRVDVKVFLLDERGRFAYVTDPLATYFGEGIDHLTGTQVTDVVADEDVAAVEATLTDVRGSDRTESRTVEAAVRTSDGDTRPVQLELSLVEGPSNAAEIAGVVTDITELAETRSTLVTERERFQELFENLPDPVVEVELVDGVPVVQYGNPAFSEAFGFEGDAIRGATLDDLIVPNDGHEPAVTPAERALSGDGTRVDVRRETADGHRDFLLRTIPYSRDTGTEGTYAFAVYTDITEQKERERYLQILNRVLRHNLRNDMNVVLALAKRLARNLEDDELAEYARTLEDNARDVASLSEKAKEIEHVLGRRGAETGSVDVAHQVRNVVDESREEYDRADISLDAPDELWAEGDDAIRRAAEELVENAVEHNDGDRVRVDVEARRDPERDGWVELRFRDDGPGIHDEEWRVVAGDEEIDQLSHGSGLGLWLTRWIVESYGGEITREQGDGDDGATVVLRLPHSPPEPERDETDREELA
jgi:PAS domain S-box-containing protein